MIPSLGSPLVYESQGTTFIRTSYYAAPLDLLVSEQDAIAAWLERNFAAHIQEGYERSGGLFPNAGKAFRALTQRLDEHIS
jgi:hypothetical protein